MMAKNWIRYGIVLLCTLIFAVSFNGYLSLYALLVTAFLPILSLLLTLPAVLSVRAEMTVEAQSAGKGQEVPLRLRLYSRSPIAGGRAWVTLDVRNTLTGEEQREQFVFTPCRSDQTVEQPLTSPACGQVVCRLIRGRVCDYLGLFALPFRLPEQRLTVLFFPVTHRISLFSQPLPMPESDGDKYSQTKPGDDPTELFGLREYREGDKLSRVHWKLSQKTGQTLYRELGLPVTDRTLFLLEWNGSGDSADAILDVFATLSVFLARQEIAHRAGFWNGVDKRFELLEIAEAEDVRPVLSAMLIKGRRGPLPPLEESMLPTGVSHLLYLSARPDPNLVASLRQQMPSARFSVLEVAEEPQASVSEGAELLAIRPGSIAEALEGFTL